MSDSVTSSVRAVGRARLQAPAGNRSEGGLSLLRPAAGSVRIGLSARRRATVALYGAAIFLSAFLLFQVELIMGRLILP